MQKTRSSYVYSFISGLLQNAYIQIIIICILVFSVIELVESVSGTSLKNTFKIRDITILTDRISESH